MAFKSLAQYQEDKNGEFFVLPNDGDHADVIFLYKSVNDVLVADVHYLKSADYSGYVHCCGKGCPACSYGDRGIKLDHKIFIPLYNFNKDKIEFWDRSTFFEQVLQKSVFGPYPNPSEIVFTITRHGEAGSRDTKYEITPTARNTSVPYEKILADFNVTFPEGYSKICREMTLSEMSSALYSHSTAPSDLGEYGYVPVARGSVSAAEDISPIPSVETSQYSAPPEVAPPSASSMPEYTPSNDVPESVAVPDAIGEINEESDDSQLDEVNF